MSTLPTGSDLTAIDLFAGAGGATTGLKQAGFRVVAAIELDPDAAGSYAVNHPEVVLYEADIATLDVSRVRGRLAIEKRSLGLLKACPPCQAFSTLGSGNPNDPRNALIAEVWAFLREFLPKVWVVENVPGINRDGRLAGLVRQARGIGYSVRSYSVDASQFGVPQRRKRHIVFGSRTGRQLPDRLEDLFPDEFPVEQPTTAGEALQALERRKRDSDPLDAYRRLKPTTLARVQAIPFGGTRFDLPDHLVLDCHRSLATRSAGASYGRIRQDLPSPTMTTRCTTPSCGSFVHPTEDRGLTLREAATLETFPHDYRFAGSYGSIERQIGNAVPVELARVLGRAASAMIGPDVKPQ